MSSPLRRSTSDMVAPSFMSPTRQTVLTRHRRAFSDEPSPCPSLLSEHVDEAVERFMTLPSPTTNDPSYFEHQEPLVELFSRNRKRHHLVDDDDSSPPVARCSFGARDDWSNNLFSDNESAIPPPKLSRNDTFYQETVERCTSGTNRDDQSVLHSEFKKPPASSPQGWPSTQQSPVLEQDAFDSLPDFLRSKSNIIEEQMVVMEQIRRDQEEAHNSHVSATNEDSKSTALARSVEAYQEPIAVGLPSPKNTEKKNCIQICPGKNVRILDRSHAMAALRENTAGLFKCAGCDTLLVASKNSKILFCSDCGTLTPTTVSKNLNSNNTEAGK